MTAKETLDWLIHDLLIKAGLYELTKDQEEQVEFIKDRLDDGEKAEIAIMEIERFIAKTKGLI